jgi:hypothetical protein
VKQPTQSDQIIIRYLLNDLPEEDGMRLEVAYLRDGDWFEQVRALEEELIEDYVKGDLSGREWELFERHYLASEQRRARIETARQLVQVCALGANEIVLLALVSGVRGINKPERAVITANTKLVELRVTMLKQGATIPAAYRVVVKSVDGGREIWRREGIKLRETISAQYVVVRVPADRFRAVDGRGFTVTLSAPSVGGRDYEELDICYFQVISR